MSYASRPRCLVVGATVTATLWGVAAVLVRLLTADRAVRAGAPGDALVRICLAALLLAVAWAWSQAVAGIADAWRGAHLSGRHGIRRLALVACGAAVAGVLAAPSYAVDEPHPHLLSGLPYPDRAEGRAHGHADPAVVVRPGDSLWGLAARDLPDRATDQRVSQRWHQIYARNRGVIGPDPDLIQPGQVLRTTSEDS